MTDEIAVHQTVLASLAALNDDDAMHRVLRAVMLIVEADEFVPGIVTLISKAREE